MALFLMIFVLIVARRNGYTAVTEDDDMKNVGFFPRTLGCKMGGVVSGCDPWWNLRRNLLHPQKQLLLLVIMD